MDLKTKILDPVLSFLKKKLKLIIFLVILIFAAITAFQAFSAIQAAKNISVTKPQSFENVESKDISNSIAVTGTIASSESRTLSTLVAKTEVEKVYVEVGDYVHEGDPICTFDTSSIESNIAKLERQIQVNNAKATLELAKANTQVAWAWEDYFDNQADGNFDLTAAMLNYQQQQNGVADAISNLEDRERALDNAKDDYHDYKKAKKNGTLSENSKDSDDYKEDIRDAEDAVASASRSLQNAELSLQNTINNYNQTVDKLKDQGRTDLRTISSNMAAVVETKLNNMTTNDNAEEQIRDYEDSLDNCNITAPISGIVTSVSVVEGDQYEEKSEICVIQDDSSYKVTGTVDEYDVSKITESMNCVIKTDATGDDQMEGILTFVSPVPQSSGSTGNSGSAGASASTGSSTEYPIEITIKGRDDRLRIGMTAEASILVESKEGIKAVPYDAIEEDKDGSFYVNLAVDKPSVSHNFPGKSSRKYSDNPLANLIAEMKLGSSAEELYSKSEPVPTKKVTVKKGLETDYYTEIISDDVKLGDRVQIPESESSSDNMPDFAIGFGGGPGGGPGGPP